MFSNFRFIIVIDAAFMLLFFAGTSFSQHQWTSLDGPYWANGLDVAYGNGGTVRHGIDISSAVMAMSKSSFAGEKPILSGFHGLRWLRLAG